MGIFIFIYKKFHLKNVVEIIFASFLPRGQALNNEASIKHYVTRGNRKYSRYTYHRPGWILQEQMNEMTKIINILHDQLEKYFTMRERPEFTWGGGLVIFPD